MSLSQQKIPESKSKSKFQSLNINNLYQGAPNKPTTKNLPAKHGLQSLGKVPTARRAPASLPSVKSEKGGNDPSVVLVPSGGGWASKEGDKEPGRAPVYYWQGRLYYDLFSSKKFFRQISFRESFFRSGLNYWACSLISLNWGTLLESPL